VGRPGYLLRAISTKVLEIGDAVECPAKGEELRERIDMVVAGHVTNLTN